MPSRRDFLKRFTFLSTGLWAPTFLVNSIQAARRTGMLRAGLGNPNRILVVVELAGGCDGLNTVIPYTNDFYHSARPTLALSESQGLLKLDDSHALHPALAGFKELWDLGQLSVIQGVGYPNPNRSHFRSRDIWHTANPETASGDGWLASYFQNSGVQGSLQGLNVGGKVPRAMVSEEGSSPSIQNVETYQVATDPKYPGDEGNKNAAFQAMLAEPQRSYRLQEYVGQTILDATLSSVQLLEGQSNYVSTVTYPAGAFANNLRTIAQVIAAGLGVTVFYTTIGGFDTHANQVAAGTPATGVHANLLDQLSTALGAFWEDMKEMGRQEDVVILTFSEFGRRLRQNGSLGTDHGTANQMFLIGNQIQPGLYAEQPGLAPDQLDPVGDMIFSIDFRSVYATVLAQWLGADPVAVLGENWGDPRLAGLVL